jgi:hypothetical protein
MATYQNIYGYLNATLHYPLAERLPVEPKNDSAPLDWLFEISPEEIAYKAYWDAYLESHCL